MGGTIGSSRSSPSWRPSGNTTIITTGPRVSFFPVIPYYGGFGYGGFGFGSTLLTFVVVAAMAYAAAQVRIPSHPNRVSF